MSNADNQQTILQIEGFPAVLSKEGLKSTHIIVPILAIQRRDHLTEMSKVAARDVWIKHH